MNEQKEKIRNDYGENLKRARKRKGFSQEDLAILSNYSPQQISYYENGKRKISQKAAECLSRILEISVYELWLPVEDERYLQESRIKREKTMPIIAKMYDYVFLLFELYGYEFVDLKCLQDEDFFIHPLTNEEIKKTIKDICHFSPDDGRSIYLPSHDALVVAVKQFPDFYIIVKHPNGYKFEVSAERFASCVLDIAQSVQCNILNLASRTYADKYNFLGTLLEDYPKI